VILHTSLRYQKFRFRNNSRQLVPGTAAVRRRRLNFVNVPNGCPLNNGVKLLNPHASAADKLAVFAANSYGQNVPQQVS
jgi:hypothetical protein